MKDQSLFWQTPLGVLLLDLPWGGGLGSHLFLSLCSQAVPTWHRGILGYNWNHHLCPRAQLWGEI